MTLAQAALEGPVGLAQDLARAQDVQGVLSVVVGALVVALVAVVAHHVRELRAWRDEERLLRADSVSRERTLTERLQAQADRLYTEQAGLVERIGSSLRALARATDTRRAERPKERQP